MKKISFYSVGLVAMLTAAMFFASCGGGAEDGSLSMGGGGTAGPETGPWSVNLVGAVDIPNPYGGDPLTIKSVSKNITGMAKKGESVTITVFAPPDKVISSVTAKGAQSVPFTSTGVDADGAHYYTFSMPASTVTITVVYGNTDDPTTLDASKNTLIDLTVDECFTLIPVQAEDDLGHPLYESMPADYDEAESGAWVETDHPIMTEKLESALNPVFDPENVPGNRTFSAAVPFLGYPAVIRAIPDNAEAEVSIVRTGADLANSSGNTVYKITVKPQVLKYFTTAELAALDPPITATETEYTVNLQRNAGSANAFLSSITITGGTFAFDKTVTTYDGDDNKGVLVPASTNSLTINATAEDSNAKVQISAPTVTSGTAITTLSPDIADAQNSASLTAGLASNNDNATIFNIQVTPQDSTKPSKTYEVKIKRDPNSRIANASGGALSYLTVGTNVYEVHTFTTSTYTTGAGQESYTGANGLNFVTGKSPATVEVLAVGGGGGAGSSPGSGNTGSLPTGGGGGGGVIYARAYVIDAASYEVKVGQGGNSPNPTSVGASLAGAGPKGSTGGNSVFGSGTKRLEAPGGGGGASHNSGTYGSGNGGGCGGGGTFIGTGGTVANFFYNGSAASQPNKDSTAAIQAWGNKGGNGDTSTGGNAAGGGGAGGAGSDAPSNSGANGGIGKLFSISGNDVYYGTGGAGSGSSAYNTGAGYGAKQANNGAADTGGGGAGTSGGYGGKGGSGVVIVRWVWNN
ncbi:MAG: hypothetical protein Ta2F_16370 [Termitinemataceae bacterium]|nr:MAG: hypothetical protein Ta2F_16370 [Termitinemataceae bacterium]